MRSLVAKAVDAPRYNARPTIAVGYYAYWSGLPAAGFEAHLRPRRRFAIAPTNDGLTIGCRQLAALEFSRTGATWRATLSAQSSFAPALAARLRRAKRESRFVGTGDLPNFFRKPYGGLGPVGGCRLHKTPSPHKASRCFSRRGGRWRVAGRCFADRATLDDALCAYQRVRDEAALPMFDLTCEFANLGGTTSRRTAAAARAIHRQPRGDAWFRRHHRRRWCLPTEFFGVQKRQASWPTPARRLNRQRNVSDP